MTQVDDSIIETLKDVNKRWGGESEFEIETIEDWKKLIKNWKKDGGKVIHLTMYGINIDDVIDNVQKENNVLVVIGAEKAPREIYDLADYNIAIGNQPHSEIAALAIFLDRAFKGKELKRDFKGAKFKIIPMAKGKRVHLSKINLSALSRLNHVIKYLIQRTLYVNYYYYYYYCYDNNNYSFQLLPIHLDLWLE
jgi:tRNA (cytidine56-2'-O)-methyltransferase